MKVPKWKGIQKLWDKQFIDFACAETHETLQTIEMDEQGECECGLENLFLQLPQALPLVGSSTLLSSLFDR